MARGTSAGAVAEQQPTKAKTTTTARRHAGPYGASFDGTDPNGKPPRA